MQASGIPFSGLDICGTTGERSDELCARWMQLGALYPLSRNYYENSTESSITNGHEAYNLPDNMKKAAAGGIQMKRALSLYYHTLLFEASQEGGSIFSPLFYMFSNEDGVYEDITHSFMLGDALKITPVLEEGATTMRSYFPNDKWYDVDNNIITHNYGDGKFIDLNATWDYINTHMRGGTIVPFLDPTGNTTEDLLTSKMTLKVLRDSAGFAAGNVYIDDGKTASSFTDGNYKYYRLIASGGSITFNKISGGTGQATIN